MSTRMRIAAVALVLIPFMARAEQRAPRKKAVEIPSSLKQAIDNALYGIEPNQRGGQRADNAANGFSVEFVGSETIIHANRASQAKLHVAQYGWGSELHAAGVITKVESVGKRLNRQYSSVFNEWFENTPQGLEQGFVVTQRDQAASGRLRIQLAATGGWRVQNARDGVRLIHGKVTLDYAGLKALDARGKRLMAWLRAAGTSDIEIEVYDKDAVYPLTIDPTYTQQAELTAPDGVSGDYFGGSVALSSDGNTALVGAINHNSFQGAAYVFARAGSSWVQQHELIAADGASGDYFGGSVALSSDGGTALVGAISHNTSKGAAYVFTRVGSTWSQQRELTASDGITNDEFGDCAALSSDGSTALVGAQGKNSFHGAAYVFARTGSIWNQQQELTASDEGPDADEFGDSVALSSEGTTALVGALQHDGHGAAYVFTRAGSTWTQQQELTASDGITNDEFGNSVALSSDGSTALVAARGKDGTQGAAYLFTRTGTSFSQQQELTAPDPGTFQAEFGESVALSTDGSTALVAAYERGAAYVFARAGSTWSQQQELTAPGVVGSSSVALSSDGTTALVGEIGSIFR